MTKEPEIPHRTIVDFILAGHTTEEAKEFFEFKNDNVANLRVHAAFKSLNIPRPRFQASKECQFCMKQFLARDKKQRTCGSEECQRALILEWQVQNKGKRELALQKYRRTEKGRQNNLRMHSVRRLRGKEGEIVDRWNYGLAEATKALTEFLTPSQI